MKPADRFFETGKVLLKHGRLHPMLLMEVGVAAGHPEFEATLCTMFGNNLDGNPIVTATLVAKAYKGESDLGSIP